MRLVRFRHLPLAGKLLLPYLILMLIVGAAGTFTVVRSLTERAEAALHQELGRDLLDARAAVRDQELYVLESANFAANVRGITERVQAQDNAGTRRLLASVRALKTELDLLVVMDSSGTGTTEFIQDGPALREGLGTKWDGQPFVREALTSRTGAATAGIIRLGDRSYLAVATPVCTGGQACTPAGAALAGMTITRVAAAAAGPRGDVALFDGSGQALSASTPFPPRLSTPAEVTVVRTTRRGEEVATMAAPFDLQGERVGTITTTLPTEPSFASVRGAAYRVALLVLVAMAGIVAIGVLLSRSILRQVRPLVTTHRALGGGDLSARASVRGDDELGEVARGLNRMAEQLEASVVALESQVDQRTAEVRRLLNQRNELFAGLSHEFRTPLAVVLAQAQLLRDARSRRSVADEESLRAMEQSARQALTLVNEFLELSRADAHQVDPALTAVSPGVVLRELGPTISGLAGAAGVHAELDVPPDLPDIRADARRLREITLNLADNAIKYTPPGGQVAVRAHSSPTHVVLEVSDTGLGIPEDDLPHVFEPFYRVETNATQAGQPSTGLGLALTKRLVDAHAGTIGVASEVGRGTTFRVSLPRTVPPQRAERDVVHEQPVPASHE